MQGMVAGKLSRGKPRQRWEKYITDTSGMMGTAGRVAEDGSDVRKRICSQEKKNVLQQKHLESLMILRRTLWWPLLSRVNTCHYRRSTRILNGINTQLLMVKTENALDVIA